MEDCLFCKIIDGAIPSTKIYEDDEVYAFMDIHPVSPGHTLVIPIEHSKNLYDTPEQTLGHMMSVIKKIAAALKQTLEADGINIEMNNEKDGGQEVFHTHIHVIPRFKNDGLKHWPAIHSTEENRDTIAKEVQKILET